MIAPELLLSKLKGVRRVESGWHARCPCHPDSTGGGLIITAGRTGAASVVCVIQGCTIDEVLAAVGLAPHDLTPALPDPPLHQHPAQIDDATETTPATDSVCEPNNTVIEENIMSNANSGARAETPALALRPRAAAKLLNVCPRTLWGWTNAGLIPCARIGAGKRQTCLYPLDALKTWLNRQAAGTAVVPNS